MHVTTLLLALAATALALPQPRAYFHPDRPHFDIVPQHPGFGRPEHGFHPGHEPHHGFVPTPTAAGTGFSAWPTAAWSAHPTGFPAHPTGFPHFIPTHSAPFPKANFSAHPTGFPHPTGFHVHPTGFSYSAHPTGFPAQQPGFSAQPTDVPVQQPGFSAQPTDVPVQQPGFPAQQPGFPAQQPGFPHPMPTQTAAAAPFPITNSTVAAAQGLPFATGTGVSAGPTGIISPIGSGGSGPGNWTFGTPWHGAGGHGQGQPHFGHGHGHGHGHGGRGRGRGGRHGKEMHDALRKGASRSREHEPSRTRNRGKYVPKATHT